jgi:hypothetical protein
MHDDEPIPTAVAASRPLAEAHRLDLALFVVFEEWCVQVAQALAPHAAPETLDLLRGQPDDDARHLAHFRRRLDQTLAAQSGRADATQALLLRVLQNGERTTAALRREEVVAAVVVPPLRRFLDRVRGAADAGEFVEALALLDLVFKGTASPLSAYEERFWRPVDPHLADLIRDADADERRHVAGAARAVRSIIGDDSARRATVAARCADARGELTDALRYYARKLVALSAAVGPLPDGRGPDELLSQLLAAGEAGCTQALRDAGLDAHG